MSLTDWVLGYIGAAMGALGSDAPPWQELKHFLGLILRNKL